MTQINQIVFDSNGYYYTANNCDGAMPFDMASTMDGKYAYPSFDGQVVNYCSSDVHFGILVREISQEEYEEITEASGGSDSYITDCGRFWTEKDVGSPKEEDIKYFLSAPQFRKYEEMRESDD
jgi:hypothetical protein